MRSPLTSGLILAVLTGIILPGSLFGSRLTNTFLEKPIQTQSYEVMNSFISNKERLFITRKITTADHKTWYYYINVDTLNYGLSDENWESALKENRELPKDSLFCRVLKIQISGKRAFGSAYELKKAGNQSNIVLTSDLCPTTNRYDRLLYESVSQCRISNAVTFPILVFFSGRWLQRHPDNLKEIKESGLSLFAGNHTFSHTIISGKYPAEDLRNEILSNEQVMLENGILPSYFFRFPGLKYKASHIESLTNLSVLAVDANAWMGTEAKDWCVLLIHSNGVASSEVRIFAKYLKRMSPDIADKKIVFQDILSYLKNRAGLQLP